MSELKRIGYGQVEANMLSAPKTGDIKNDLPVADEINLLENGMYGYYDVVKGKIWSGVEVGGTDEAPTYTLKAKGEPMLVYNERKYNNVSNMNQVGEMRRFCIRRLGADINGVESENYIFGDSDITMALGDTIRSARTGAGADNTNNGLSYLGYRMDGFSTRLFGTRIGELYTTNFLIEDVTYSVGDELTLFYDIAKKMLILGKGAVAGKYAAITGDTKIKYVIAEDYTMPDGQVGFKIMRVQ